MVKESRIIVRLIALWIIFMASLGLLFWSGQQFAVSLIKITSGSYQDGNCQNGYCPPPLTFTSCILSPQYPLSQPMGMEGVQTPVDQGAMSKYTDDYQKYSQEYQKACQQDVARQQGSQKNSSTTGLAGYSVLLLLAVVSSVISFMAIRKSEMEA